MHTGFIFTGHQGKSHGWSPGRQRVSPGWTKSDIVVDSQNPPSFYYRELFGALSWTEKTLKDITGETAHLKIKAVATIVPLFLELQLFTTFGDAVVKIFTQFCIVVQNNTN